MLAAAYTHSLAHSSSCTRVCAPSRRSGFRCSASAVSSSFYIQSLVTPPVGPSCPYKPSPRRPRAEPRVSQKPCPEFLFQPRPSRFQIYLPSPRQKNFLLLHLLLILNSLASKTLILPKSQSPVRLCRRPSLLLDQLRPQSRRLR